MPAGVNDCLRGRGPHFKDRAEEQGAAVRRYLERNTLNASALSGYPIDRNDNNFVHRVCLVEIILSVPAVLLCLSAVYGFFLIAVSIAVTSNGLALHLRFWVLTFWAPFTGGVLIAFRPYVSAWISDYLGCMLFVTGFAACWLGMRAYHHRSLPALLPLCAVLGIIPLGLMFDGSEQTLALSRQVYVFSAAALFLFLTAAELWRGVVREGLAGARFGAAIFSSFAAIHLIALPFSVLMPIDFTGRLPISGWLFIMIIASLLHTVAAVFAVVVMIKERAETAVRVLADTDSLTGLTNRRAFTAKVETLLSDETERGGGFLLFDIDHFKRINDTHGHHGGDTVLRQFSAILAQISGERAICGRLGGEEFGLFLPGKTGPVLDVLAQRLCRAISLLKVSYNGGDIRLTVSIGVSDTNGRTCHFILLFEEADAALYEAKRGGRNQARRYDPGSHAPGLRTLIADQTSVGV